MRRIATAALLAAALVGLTGCGASTSSTPVPVKSGDACSTPYGPGTWSVKEQDCWLNNADGTPATPFPPIKLVLEEAPVAEKPAEPAPETPDVKAAKSAVRAEEAAVKTKSDADRAEKAAAEAEESADRAEKAAPPKPVPAPVCTEGATMLTPYKGEGGRSGEVTCVNGKWKTTKESVDGPPAPNNAPPQEETA